MMGRENSNKEERIALLTNNNANYDSNKNLEQSDISEAIFCLSNLALILPILKANVLNQKDIQEEMELLNKLAQLYPSALEVRNDVVNYLSIAWKPRFNEKFSNDRQVRDKIRSTFENKFSFFEFRGLLNVVDSKLQQDIMKPGTRFSARAA